MKTLLSFFAFALMLSAYHAQAQDLVYKPINPAFGGDTFNYQWLLSSAQAQNRFEDKSGGFSKNPLDDFEASLNRQILNELSRKLITQIFGEGEIEDGSFTFGTLQVTIASELEGVSITIVNNSDGSQTSITVPYQ
ncbi:MAG: curli production assembly/transport component CsgF [Cyclobacteriaceae bacterium]